MSRPSSAVGRFFSPENRYLAPLLITTILLVSQVSFGLLESFSRTALAIATSMLFDLVLGRLMYRTLSEPGQRVHHRNQRRYPGSFAGLLALRALCRALHHFQVRSALEGTPSLEPFEFWYLRHSAARAGVRRHAQCPVGQ